MAFLAHSVVARSAQAAWQSIDGEVVVLHLGVARVMGLNDLGGRVWALIDGRRTVRDIARDIAALASAAVASRDGCVAPEQVLADVLAFIEVLAGKGLVEAAGQDKP